MTLPQATLPATAQRKITRRLLPFLFLVYMMAQMDRSNVAFAGLNMTRELHFSNEVFGFGAGIFFSDTACCRYREPCSRNAGARASGSRPS